MIWAVFMGDLNHINPPVVPLFKGGQALGISNMVPVWKVFSGKYLVSGTNARHPFSLSTVPLFFQKGDHRGIPYSFSPISIFFLFQSFYSIINTVMHIFQCL